MAEYRKRLAELDKRYIPAAVDFSDVRTPAPGLTEQQAISKLGLGNQRSSENVEIRPAPYGRSVDEQVRNNWVKEETIDYLAALYGGLVPGAQVNPASFTTDPYENLDKRPPHRWDEDRTYPDISAGLYPHRQARRR